jgi:hypothetical protein
VAVAGRFFVDVPAAHLVRRLQHLRVLADQAGNLECLKNAQDLLISKTDFYILCKHKTLLNEFAFILEKFYASNINFNYLAAAIFL